MDPNMLQYLNLAAYMLPLPPSQPMAYLASASCPFVLPPPMFSQPPESAALDLQLLQSLAKTVPVLRSQVLQLQQEMRHVLGHPSDISHAPTLLGHPTRVGEPAAAENKTKMCKNLARIVTYDCHLGERCKEAHPRSDREDAAYREWCADALERARVNFPRSRAMLDEPRVESEAAESAANARAAPPRSGQRPSCCPKTRLCWNWLDNRQCSVPFCQFAHGNEEKRVHDRSRVECMFHGKAASTVDSLLQRRTEEKRNSRKPPADADHQRPARDERVYRPLRRELVEAEAAASPVASARVAAASPIPQVLRCSYKTRICWNYMANRKCSEPICSYAHGNNELRMHDRFFCVPECFLFRFASSVDSPIQSRTEEKRNSPKPRVNEAYQRPARDEEPGCSYWPTGGEGGEGDEKSDDGLYEMLDPYPDAANHRSMSDKQEPQWMFEEGEEEEQKEEEGGDERSESQEPYAEPGYDRSAFDEDRFASFVGGGDVGSGRGRGSTRDSIYAPVAYAEPTNPFLDDCRGLFRCDSSDVLYRCDDSPQLDRSDVTLAASIREDADEQPQPRSPYVDSPFPVFRPTAGARTDDREEADGARGLSHVLSYTSLTGLGLGNHDDNGVRTSGYGDASSQFDRSDATLSATLRADAGRTPRRPFASSSLYDPVFGSATAGARTDDRVDADGAHRPLSSATSSSTFSLGNHDDNAIGRYVDFDTMISERIASLEEERHQRKLDVLEAEKRQLRADAQARTRQLLADAKARTRQLRADAEAQTARRLRLSALIGGSLFDLPAATRGGGGARAYNRDYADGAHHPLAPASSPEDGNNDDDDDACSGYRLAPTTHDEISTDIEARLAEARARPPRVPRVRIRVGGDTRELHATSAGEVAHTRYREEADGARVLPRAPTVSSVNRMLPTDANVLSDRERSTFFSFLRNFRQPRSAVSSPDLSEDFHSLLDEPAHERE